MTKRLATADKTVEAVVRAMRSMIKMADTPERLRDANLCARMVYLELHALDQEVGSHFLDKMIPTGGDVPIDEAQFLNDYAPASTSDTLD